VLSGEHPFDGVSLVVAPILPGSDLGIEGFAIADAAAPPGPTARIASLKNKAQYLAFIYVYATCSTSRPPKPTCNATSRHSTFGPSDGPCPRRDGLIPRQPGVARSIAILVPPYELPILEWRRAAYVACYRDDR
jgi:hypothetical protein